MAARLFLCVQGIVPDNGGRDDRPEQFRQSGSDHCRSQAGHEARGNIRLLTRVGSKYRTQDGNAHRCADHACRIEHTGGGA